MSKYTKRTMIECTCCGKIRSLKNLTHLGDMPTVYVCDKCLEDDPKKVNKANGKRNSTDKT
jgi:hypothetical protein